MVLNICKYNNCIALNTQINVKKMSEIHRCLHTETITKWTTALKIIRITKQIKLKVSLGRVVRV